MSALIDDLKFAQQTGKAVEITLLGGERIFTGVHSVDEADGTASLWAPQTFGDSTTRRRIRLDDLMSVTVTDIDYRPRE